MNVKRFAGPALLVLAAFGFSLLSPAAVEAFAGALPAVTSLLATIFAITVLARWRSNGRRYLLFWGIGLCFYALGTAMEAAFGLFGWHPWLFRAYYLSGAVLTAAWLGQGTIFLLARRWLPKASLVVLSLGTLYGIYEVGRAELEPVFMSDRLRMAISADAATSGRDLLKLAGQTVATPGGALMDVWARTIAERAAIDFDQVAEAPQRLGYGVGKGAVLVGTRSLMEQQGVDVSAIQLPNAGRTVPIYVAQNGQARGAILFEPPLELNGSAIIRSSSNIRSLTPFFNVYGTLALAGGAIYSAYIFWRKRVLYNRMIGNILIGLGALSPALGGTLSKAGFPTALYISELIGIVLIFIGYTQAVKTEEPAPVAASQPVHA
jgi:predicted secreted protein